MAYGIWHMAYVVRPVSVSVEVSPLVIVTALGITIVVIITAVPIAIAILVVIGVSAIRLGVSALEALAVVKAATLVANRGGRIVTETREDVPPPRDQSVIETPSLFQ